MTQDGDNVINEQRAAGDDTAGMTQDGDNVINEEKVWGISG